MSDLVVSKYSKTWLEDNIIHQSIMPSVTSISLPVAKQLIEDRLKIIGSVGLKLNLILITNNTVSIKDEALKFYKYDKSAFNGVNAMAVLADNYYTKLTFKLAFSKKKVSVELFNDKKKALKWLSQFSSFN